VSPRDPAPPRDPAGSGPSRDPGSQGPAWDSDELIGLDPQDPEAQAFAAHLARIRRDRPGFTVEGYLDGVTDFADSANRSNGGRRLLAVVLVGLLLLVAAFLIWDALRFVVTTWL
jgi:hypothetical protein